MGFSLICSQHCYDSLSRWFQWWGKVPVSGCVYSLDFYRSYILSSQESKRLMAFRRGLRSALGEKLHKALCLLQVLWYSSANITACLLRELWVFPWRPGKNQRQKLELSQQETNQEATVIHFSCVLWHFSEDTIKNPTRKNEQLGTSSHSWKHLILPHNRGCRPCCLQIRLLPGFRFQ